MAVWQYDILIIPQHKIEQLGSPSCINNDLYDQIQWWNSSIPPQDIARRIDRILERSSSWSESLLTWGIEDGNRIDLMIENNLVSELQVRFDIRNLSKHFLQQVVGLANAFGGVFCSDEGTLIPPDLPSLARAMAASDAAHFVADPAGFLDNLTDKRN